MKAPNLIVFRDTTHEICGDQLLARLRVATEELRTTSDPENLLTLLLSAGEVERALADCDWSSRDAAMEITDEVARLYAASRRCSDLEIAILNRKIAGLTAPDSVRVSACEGFAYYGLHPQDFADAALARLPPASTAVVGIRSIGTVLSALVVAALRNKGLSASRMTVRPTGHPYNRAIQFTERERAWVEEQRLQNAAFVVVDEGPGLSGSSFLSVAEALIARGVDQRRITMIGTRSVNPDQLFARDAAKRWSQFEWHGVRSRISSRFAGKTTLGAGEWRGHFLSSCVEWPACWPEMERLKFLSEDRRVLFKFEGFGQVGKESRERASALCKAGLGPRVEDAGDGMTAYGFIPGRPLARQDLSRKVLEGLADYCAFRAAEFTTQNQSGKLLEQMAAFNFVQEFGWELDLPRGSLDPTCPVISDGRMQPYEWVAAPDARLKKLDAVTHGDDHFLPGPVDIVWDLAGAIVEWNLDSDAETFLIDMFQRRTGIDTSSRLCFFRAAYVIFRMSYCKMARSATQTSSERSRLQSAYIYYRDRLELMNRVRHRTHQGRFRN